MGFKKFDGSVWQSINPKKLKGIPYTGTLPAVLAGTKAGYLHKYKIYGNLSQNGTPTPSDPIYPSECGERTGNLLNKTGAQSGYITDDGTVVSEHANLMYTDYIPVSDDVTFLTQSYDRNALVMGAPAMCFYDESKTYISGVAFSQAYTKTFQKPPNAKYIRTCYRTTMDWVMLNSGSTALPYEPYGYKLPLTSAGQDVNIYIGDDTLSTDEYVDSRTGKIYRMVDGVLTPVDPPVPFPQIPTSAGSTTISWAGSGLAPSQFDSIQEWVDIPTYKRVNGEWVADN